MASVANGILVMIMLSAGLTIPDDVKSNNLASIKSCAPEAVARYLHDSRAALHASSDMAGASRAC